MSISTEVVKTRIYVTGNTYSVKDQLKAVGCHWDSDRRQWWIGATKGEELKALIAKLDSGEAAPAKEDFKTSRVYAKVSYKDKTYYTIAQSGTRYRLVPFDGSISFWVDGASIVILKTYESRTRWCGYSRKNVTEHQTLGGLQQFVKRSQDAAKAISKGEIPAGYARDLEDGVIKPRSECDMPE